MSFELTSDCLLRPRLARASLDTPKTPPTPKAYEPPNQLPSHNDRCTRTAQRNSQLSWTLATVPKQLDTCFHLPASCCQPQQAWKLLSTHTVMWSRLGGYGVRILAIGFIIRPYEAPLDHKFCQTVSWQWLCDYRHVARHLEQRLYLLTHGKTSCAAIGI